MSKNLTRKSLALGAIVALTGSLLTSVSASAAASEQLTLLPSIGTSYQTIEGETFNLTEGLLPGSAQPISNTTTLKYSVTTATGTVIEATWPKINGVAAVAQTAVSPSVQPALTTVFAEATTPVPGANQTIQLKVGALAAGATASVSVTAFFDVNGDNVYNEGNDPASATRTIKWVALEDVKGTVALTQPYVGDTTAKATVVLDGYNQQQISAHTVAVHFTDAAGSALKGVTASSSAAATDIVVAPFAASTANYSATSPALTALVRPATVTASGSVMATAYIRPGASQAATTFASNSAATPTVIAATAVKLGSQFSAAVVRTYDSVITSTEFTANSLAATSSAADAANITRTLAASVRVNSPVSVSALLAKGAVVQPNALINLKVTTPVTLSSTKTLTVNGTTYSTNASLPTELALTSNDKGVVTATFTTAGFEVGNAVALEFKGQSLTNTVTATSVALTYDVYETNNNTPSADRSMDLASSMKLGYQVVDQFKEPIVSGFRLRLTATNTNGSPLTISPAFFEGVLADGKTEFTLGNAAVGVYTVAVAMEKFNSATLLWDPVTTGVTAPATINMNVIAAQTDVVGLSFATGENSEDVADAAEKSNDIRVSRVTSSTYAAAERATLGVLVSQAITDIGRKGATVTVAAPGLLFATAASGYEVADTFTTYADAAGIAAVDVISNIEGTYTLTVTSGKASSTIAVTFVSTLPTASVAFKATPTQVSTQRTQFVTVVTKDKYENLVGDVINFDNTGVGYFITTTTTTSEVTGEGSARFGVWLNETGTSFLTATFSATVKAGATITWGITDVEIETAGKRIIVTPEFALDKRVTVFVNGKRIYSAVMSTDEARTLGFTQRRAGTYTVIVRITGGIQYSERVTLN